MARREAAGSALALALYVMCAVLARMPWGDWLAPGPSPEWVSPRTEVREAGASPPPPIPVERRVRVTATAYTCRRQETDSTPWVTASGMRCGHPVIGVSRDLWPALRGRRVRVGGEVYVVGDTMHRRWRRRIDLPARSVRAARLFGVRRGVVLEVLK